MDTIDRLRETELRSIRSAIRDDNLPQALKALDERGSAQDLVTDQYSGRYPFELLQNANDAALNSGRPGRAHFLLTETALIVADNGMGFGDEQIEAICSLGRSSKGPGSAIGHKGLGFKAVGEISDTPQMLSGDVGFTFDRSRVRDALLQVVGSVDPSQRFPVYAFPFPASPEDVGQDLPEVERLKALGFDTIIRLPLRNQEDRAIVAQHLIDNLDPDLLLFLNGVNHLSLEGTDRDFSAEVVRDVEGIAEHALLEIGDDEEEWLIYRDSFEPDPDDVALLGGAWQELAEVKFAVAVPLDEDGQPKLGDIRPLHVYFPTEETLGLRLAVHAEWALSMDRRHIADTPAARPFNRRLLREVAQFATTTVTKDLRLRFRGSLAAAAIVCPLRSQPVSAAALSLLSLWVQGLSSTEFLTTMADRPASPSQVRLLPSSLPSVVVAHDLADLQAERTLRADLESTPEIRELVRATADEPEMTISNLLDALRDPSRDTLDRYYGFLMDWRQAAPGTFLVALKALPCVLVSTGGAASPSRTSVFLPRQQGDVELPASLPVPIAVVPSVDGVEAFLKDLGVRPFEWHDLIREYLIKILANPEADPVEYANAMEGLRAYHAVRMTGNEALGPVLGRVLLPTRNADGTVVGLRRAAETYFGADWTGIDDLEAIYGPFGEPEFLGLPAPGDVAVRESERAFYTMLGVQDRPRIERAEAEPTGYLLTSTRHPHSGAAFREWLASPDVAATAKCSDGHPQGQQLKLSHRLDRHESIVAAQDPIRLHALWRQLASHWGETYSRAMTAEFRCVNTSHGYQAPRTCESLFAHLLRNSSWVPVIRRDQPELVRPDEAWLVLQPVGRVRDRVASISDSMLNVRGSRALAEALNVVDAARPSKESLLALLEGMAVDVDAGVTLDRDLIQAARWVQRSLHEVLAPGDRHPEPESVRLLARSQGSHAFVAQPPFANDPLLRETWESQMAVLAAESGLTRLTDYLALTCLDTAVQATAIPYGTHIGDRFEQAAAAHIQQIKPYLLALVTNESARAESRTRSALRRLELVVCDELVLRYRYLEREIERQDAVCFIDERNDGTVGRPRYTATAYLELDGNGSPHWFPLGRLLAQYVDAAPLADAFTMLFTATSEDRNRLMADRGITADDIAAARASLRLPADDEVSADILEVLDLLPPVSPRTADDAASDGVIGAPTPPTVATSGDSARAHDPIDVAASPNVGLTETERSLVADPTSLTIESGRLTDFPDADRRTAPAASRTGHSTAPTVESDLDRRRVGKAGEELVYELELRRLLASGRAADAVTWVSLEDETAPYDLTSVDEANQRMYIEVKSTRDPNPATAFFMSQAELLFAIEKRSHYWIYRVSGLGTEEPRCVAVQDPIAAIIDGKGRLLLSNAHVTLAFEGQE